MSGHEWDASVEDLLKYLAGVRQTHPDAVQEIIDRRSFAVPLDGSLLDPADPEDRRLLTLGDDELIIDQLWDDDPPELWQAAKRCLAQGMSRTEVLAALAAVDGDLTELARLGRRPTGR